MHLLCYADHCFVAQMAYLLVVRATLMDKVEALQEQLEASDQQCAKLNAQINVSPEQTQSYWSDGRN